MTSPTTPSSRLSQHQKKANHIASEAKRREMIRTGFDDLASLIPGMEGQGRSEAAMMQAAVQFLKEQLEQKSRLKAEAMAMGMAGEEFERMFEEMGKSQEGEDEGEEEGTVRGSGGTGEWAGEGRGGRQ
ncbi:hypothetical protein LTR62_007049 [Meristemomyces frigidus]|uniref:BHLH domain-containing protein n=1 Tax=Meristemomyces frigidus TaxID=1508187 RepID=A0AAN7TBL1_9PEZI|nr:hypothetical protein LTR62_007049 [Meristemomyces frigidus]